MTKKAKVNSKIEYIVQLIQDNELREEFGESFSSILINPAVSWAKFVLTDDRPNANSQRIPEEEFQNLIKTGTYMPVKMARGEIKDGHDNSEPLGVMTHLKQEGNKVVAIAALWSRERPADIEYIKTLLENDEPVNISWELLYGEASITDEGIQELRDVALRAATIVGLPAYAGRTPVLAIAAKKWSPAYIKSLPDTCFLLKNRQLPYKDIDGKIDVTRFPSLMEEIQTLSLPENELKIARQKLKRLKEMTDAGASITDIDEEIGLKTDLAMPSKMEDKNLEKLEELQAQNSALQETLASKESEISALKADIERMSGELKTASEKLELQDTELTSLKEFKQAADVKAESDRKLSAIRAKFEEAGFKKSDEYFAQNTEFLLGLDENQVDFMIQELVAFSKENGNTESASKKKVPNLTTEPKTQTIKDIAKALRERKTV